MNIPTVEVIRGRRNPSLLWFAVVTSGQPDQYPGCYWNLYDAEGKTVSWGSSKGWDGTGAGSFPAAMKLAKAAARRRDKP